MKKHVYLAIENVGLNDAQRDTFIGALKKLGPPWKAEEVHGFTPIVREYDEEGNLISETGGEPTVTIKYVHSYWGNPAWWCHIRPRLDKQAVIVEALFEEENITVGHFKNKLANIFSVDPSTIDSVAQQTQYGPLVIYSRGGDDKLRFLLFGGVNATWDESGDACRSYLADNIAEWEEDG